MNIFEITSEDISALGDTDLRTLVGLLCEIEFRNAGLPVSDIAWGGNQDAPDGGLDVAVRTKFFPKSIDFIPRNFSGYQVKKSNITATGIEKEMKPNGILRSSIKDLIKVNGAYIIVSAASVTDLFLERRKDAMRKAVAHHRGCKNLHLEFLDASKLASWVRKHASVILWLREKLGRSLAGWQPFGNWAGKNGIPITPYILDESFRIHSQSVSDGSEMNAVKALKMFRELLLKPGASVRLTGLSGVGKTRFVQALFEDSEGDSLNKGLAVYTDMSQSPNPDPGTMCKQLKAQGAKAVLVIDNCPPTLHKQLTTLSSASDSNISLITIEYDVRDDLPEETDVFVMEPSSENLIQTLIEGRFPEIGPTNARTISSISGGNARVAIALAGTVKKSESLSTLRDDELFERLFKQRNTVDVPLQMYAEVCSLVYSFEGTKTEEGSELSFLAKLINIEPEVLYRKVAELKRRNLVQSRSVWRAVLPHAIANKLAKMALESIPLGLIVGSFEKGGQRLLKSFSRRLGYLDDSEEATKIAKEWLQPNNLLGLTKGNLNDLGFAILNNIAPLAPDQVLDFLERAAGEEDGETFTSRKNPRFNDWVRLLSLLAYDQQLFHRATRLICKFARTERSNENNNSIRYQLGKLFQLYLSGTHASVQDRATMITELLSSIDTKEQSLGVVLLEKALMTRSFTGSDYAFGARPRDYGYMPKTNQDIVDWFNMFVALCKSMAIQQENQYLRREARKLLGNNFRALWHARLFDLMEETARAISESGFWNEGWIGVSRIYSFDKEKYDQGTNGRLTELELLLRPVKLLDRAKTIILAGSYEMYDFNGGSDETNPVRSFERTQQEAKEIGSQVAKDEVKYELLPVLLTTENSLIHIFGIGFGEGCENLSDTWNLIYKELFHILPENRKFQFVIGFLKTCARRDVSLYNTTMDQLIGDPLIGPWFPYIQGCMIIDLKGIDRLKKSIELEIAEIQVFRNIEFASYDDAVSDDQFIGMLRSLLAKRNGVHVVFQCLYARFERRKIDDSISSNKLIDFAASVLADYTFVEAVWESLDHCLGCLVKFCLGNKKDEAVKVCRNLKTAINDYRIYTNYEDLIKSLAVTQPHIFLDEFTESSEIDLVSFSWNSYYDSRSFDFIAEEEILSWAIENQKRIPSLLSRIVPYRQPVDGVNAIEWKPILYRLLKIAPDINAALQSLRAGLGGLHWDDETEQGLDEYKILMDSFDPEDNREMQLWVKEMQSEFTKRREYALILKMEKLKLRDQTFE